MKIKLEHEVPNEQKSKIKENMIDSETHRPQIEFVFDANEKVKLSQSTCWTALTTCTISFANIVV